MEAGKRTGSYQAEVGPLIVQDVLFFVIVALRNVLDAWNLIPPPPSPRSPFNLVTQLGTCI